MKNTVMDYDTMNFGKFLSEERISLTLEQVNWAANISQTLATHPRQQWQVYLNSLARLGIIEWLQQRAPELVQENDLTGDLGELYLESIYHLKVGNFKLNLIVTDSSMNPEVCVPRIFLEDIPNSRQFYVLVEVIEDVPALEDSEEQVNISVLGYLTSDQLNQHNPIILDDELALFSTDWFELEPDRLLLYLRCFESETVGNQQSGNSTQPSIAASQNRLYQTSQSALNVGNWLKNQLGQFAEELSWTLLPPLSYSSAFRELRSPIELFSDAVTELRNQAQLVIPYEARTAYKEFMCGEIAMRLYVTTWQIDADFNSPEWTLLLVLAAQPSSNLPVGTQLTVRDELQVLEAPVLSEHTEDYIYAQVIGAYDEQFYVSISCPDGNGIILPPFTFVG